MLDGTVKHVPAATAAFADRRGYHYWDAKGALIRSFKKTLGLSVPAWDVFLIYPPGIRWSADNPPKPTFWMHQLGEAKRLAPMLDPVRFRQALRDALGRPTRPRKPT